MSNKLLLKSFVLTIFAVFAVVVTIYALSPRYVGTRAGKEDENYIKSENCLSCHENHYQSWAKTHHSKMTQLADEKSILGDFEKENTFDFLGIKSRMEKRGNEFFINFEFPDGRKESNKITKTVGSRRIQQYVTTRDGQNIRLPIAYDLENKRWMSLNGSFFYPDSENFNQHQAQWDLNCVFCHNVKAQPNFNFQTRKTNTEVAEVGIACGACHAEGAEHAQKALSPWTRTFWHLNETSEKNIVHPKKLDAERSTMICGHCHGQRVPVPENRIREILSKGDPFDAGENLAEFYQPVHAETKIGNVSFAARFWANGSPRLTAYEYQAMLRSACHTKSKSSGKGGIEGNKINCLSCHSMHEGDIKGQLTEDMKTNQACNQCHTEFNNQETLKLHTKHDLNSRGSSCVECHAPKVVYGVMTFHRTHDFQIPRPELTASQAVPNACNQCHTDKSVNWAIAESKRLWPQTFFDAKPSPDPQFDLPEAERALFAGDALTRALAAYSLTEYGNPENAAPLLAEAFATENYPIVRHFAANGLAATHWNLEKPDYLGDVNKRQAQINKWFAQIEAQKREAVKISAEKLRKLRKDVDLEVGE